MKAKNYVLTRHSIKSRFVSWSIALFIMLLAVTGPAFATPAENAPIWRAQITLTTADVGDAGTDDTLSVRLGGSNKTWLDYGRDDFPRNNTFTYDLNLENLRVISDLDFITISKTGDDGVCLKWFTLLINGRVIYRHVFPGSGHWLDTESGDSPTYHISGSTLRQNDSWLAYAQPPAPLGISHAETESRIEGMVGHFITGNRLDWGPKYGRAYVEVARKANAVNTLHVDLDLHADVPGFDPEVDVDFDIQVRCVNEQITLRVLNVKVDVDSNWITEVLSLGLIELFDDYLTDRLNQGLRGINLGLDVDVPFCPVIVVDAEGDIRFSLPASGGAQAAAEQSSAAQVVSGKAIDDGIAPLAVDVELADQLKADAETAYTVLLKSNRAEPSEVNVRIALPALITPGGALIEVKDAAGERQLAPQFSAGENGETLLDFSDRLEPGAENRYSLNLRFPYAPKAEAQINVTAVEADGKTSINSATSLHLENGAVKVRGTFQASKVAKPAPAPEKTDGAAKGTSGAVGK